MNKEMLDLEPGDDDEPVVIDLRHELPRREKPEPPAPRMSWAFLADVNETDPEPLVLGRLDPDDHTVLFGDGSTGKGVYSAWLVARLTQELGDAVVILDYEAHARFEWRPRVRRFGGDLGRVIVAQPDRAIWSIADEVRELADRLRAIQGVNRVWLVVDSIGYACLGQEIEKSSTATSYSAAIVKIGLPTLSLAHTTKSNASPQHPFGSVFWSNGARVTIGMSGYGDKPRLLENRKTNQRGAFPPVEIDWSWAVGNDPTPATLVETVHKETNEDRMLRASLASPAEGLTEAELAERSEVPLESVRTILKRDRGKEVNRRAWLDLGGKPNRVRTTVSMKAEPASEP